MANREQRGGREKRKPKAEKPKASAAQVPLLGRALDSARTKGKSGKKGQ